jgi:flavodoxin
MPPRSASQTNAAPKVARQIAAELNRENVTPTVRQTEDDENEQAQQRHVA